MVDADRQTPALAGTSPADDPIVVVEHLRKEFRVRGVGRHHEEFVAVEDATFSVARGGSLGIVGESGSGKTTIARMLTGLERPTSGTIVVAGRDRSLPARRASERRRRGRDMQIVFQDPYTSLDPRQRVSACIGEVLKLHTELDTPSRRQRIVELLDQVGLDERQGRSVPRNLSGGQRQRVAIARALAAEPEVLVLDEAVSALDVSIQAQVLNLLSEIREQTRMAFVFISHNLAVVRQLTEDVIVLRDGAVVEAGSTDQILGSPQADYTKLLLASVPGPGWAPQRSRSVLARQ